MIRSKVVTDDQKIVTAQAKIDVGDPMAVNNSGQLPQMRPIAQTPASANSNEVWGFIFALLLVGIITWVVHPKNILPLDLFLWQPIMILAAMALIGIWFKIWYKANAESAWFLLKVNLPAALAGSLLFGLVGLWPQSSGSLPLTFNQIPAYFFTLGFWPLIAGPIAMLRGFVLGFALFVFWSDFKVHRNDLRAVAGGIGTWLFGSLALVLPSIIVVLTAAFSGNGLLQTTGADLIGAFSRTNLNTFWSNAQLTRWFTGFGGELPNMITLFTASWLLVVVFWLLVTVFWRPKNFIQLVRDQRENLWNFLLMISAAVVGLSVGWGRMRGSHLDLAADLVFVTFLIFWNLATKDVTRQSTSVRSDVPRVTSHVPRIVFLILSSILLGWPVLLPTLLGLIVLWLRTHLSSSGESDETRGSNGNNLFQFFLRHPIWSQGVLSAVLWLSLADASLAFIRGAQVVSDDMMVKLLALGSVALVGIAATFVRGRRHSWLITAAAWLAAGLMASYALGTFLPGAVALLSVALGHIWYKLKGDFTRWLPQIIMIYLSVVLIFAFWLPRWLNPRMLPL
ncbi:MAG: hypothetical protein PHS79_03750 [Patescibacteria group bacterium]|nr:hypothetical protein [Patescibacteria group bacterium]